MRYIYLLFSLLTKNNRQFSTVLLFMVLFPLVSSAQDLVIKNTRILDVETGTVTNSQMIIIEEGWITEISGEPRDFPENVKTFDADGQILTPGFVDVHGHLAYILGDSVSTGGGYITHLDVSKDSLDSYRDRYARAYLPHGVTTVLDAGSTEKDLNILSEWYMQSSPDMPDFYPSGAALISQPQGDRTTFSGHTVVKDTAAARAKIRSYYNRGFRHIKLYWRLREPEFRAALDEAKQLNMNVTGHVDFHVLGFQKALDLGLRSFEHFYTVGVGAMTDVEYNKLWRQDVPEIYSDRRRGLFHLAMMEVFNQLGLDNPDMDTIIQRLADVGSTVSSSLHIFAQQVGAAPFRNNTGKSFDDVSGLSDKQLTRAKQGYEIMTDYVLQMHNAGVRLTLATDWLEPGRVALSEMLLLNQAGISMPEVFRIATLNGAQSLGLEDRGNVRSGMKADLVIWQKNPLENPEALFEGKTIIKNGKVVTHKNKLITKR